MAITFLDIIQAIYKRILMAGILGYLSVLTDDISSLAGKTMATTAKSLATSLDDIGLLFDDIATYTKLASIKSSGLLVDDLAAIANFTNETTSDILKRELSKAKSVDELKQNIEKLDEKSKKEILLELENIRQTAILEAKRKAALRELPIVYKIAKGSFKNKFIIIPIVLLLSYLAPWAISPILILGGIYLAYEGVESILEKLGHHHEVEDEIETIKELSSEKLEDEKVKSAVKTDFILSFEIIVISLSLIENTEFITKLSVLTLVGLLTTIFVYGIVALIIKLDDIGFYLQEKKSAIAKTIGNAFVNSMPWIIKGIGILGTIAMLAVGGGIIAHETHVLHSFDEILKSIPLGSFFVEIILGGIIGFLAVKIVPIFMPIFNKFKKN
jgi:predicted DNA repair protein MutK